ncbi:MAG: hypothetical protein WDO70_00560 [Alphaproteobacteria bacterium]
MTESGKTGGFVHLKTLLLLVMLLAGGMPGIAAAQVAGPCPDMPDYGFNPAFSCNAIAGVVGCAAGQLAFEGQCYFCGGNTSNAISGCNPAIVPVGPGIDCGDQRPDPGCVGTSPVTTAYVFCKPWSNSTGRCNGNNDCLPTCPEPNFLSQQINCPAGYTLNPNDGFCYKLNSTTAGGTVGISCPAGQTPKPDGTCEVCSGSTCFGSGDPSTCPDGYVKSNTTPVVCKPLEPCPPGYIVQSGATGLFCAAMADPNAPIDPSLTVCTPAMINGTCMLVSAGTTDPCPPGTPDSQVVLPPGAPGSEPDGTPCVLPPPPEPAAQPNSACGASPVAKPDPSCAGLANCPPIMTMGPCTTCPAGMTYEPPQGNTAGGCKPQGAQDGDDPNPPLISWTPVGGTGGVPFPGIKLGTIPPLTPRVPGATVAAIDVGIEKLAMDLTEECDPDTVIGQFNAAVTARVNAINEVLDPALDDTVHLLAKAQAHVMIGQWCDFNIDALGNLVDLIQSFTGIAGLIWAIIRKAVVDFVNAVLNAICTAVVSTLSTALGTICLPKIDMPNIKIPTLAIPGLALPKCAVTNALYSWIPGMGSMVNGMPIGTVTNFTKKPQPVTDSYLTPGAARTGRIRVIK